MEHEVPSISGGPGLLPSGEPRLARVSAPTVLGPSDAAGAAEPAAPEEAMEASEQFPQYALAATAGLRGAGSSAGSLKTVWADGSHAPGRGPPAGDAMRTRAAVVREARAADTGCSPTLGKRSVACIEGDGMGLRGEVEEEDEAAAWAGGAAAAAAAEATAATAASSRMMPPPQPHFSGADPGSPGGAFRHPLLPPQPQHMAGGAAAGASMGSNRGRAVVTSPPRDAVGRRDLHGERVPVGTSRLLRAERAADGTAAGGSSSNAAAGGSAGAGTGMR